MKEFFELGPYLLEGLAKIIGTILGKVTLLFVNSFNSKDLRS